MRIGIFTESYEPIINGVSVCVSTLRDELARRGHEVFIFAPDFRGHVDTAERVFRFPSFHTIFMPDYPFPVPYSPQIKRQFAQLKLDVIHTQTPFLLGLLGAKWAKRHSIPLVSTNHTLYTEYAHYVPVRPKAFTRNFLVGLMRWYYSRCDAVVAPSTPVQRMLKSYGIKTRTQVIKTGVVSIPPIDPSERMSVRERFGIADGGFMLLYVGRIAREKNLTMLLRAFKIVSKNHPSAKLALVGGGPALAETQQFASELGLMDKLTFTGMLSRNKIEPIFASADAFAFPSTTETQGIAICEALSAGLPVVAVNAGGIPENIQHGVDGFLTENSAEEFADCIDYLISNKPERIKMGENARKNAVNFSIERMADDFEELYRSVIK
ncbi:MAG: glycosyltransferase family 4 protein [Armatimonadetes bacterium]|nr:glycosyltransferase family 4 protein [Armatimonadota bacterium]